MAIIRTSGTNLFDRCVRVDRRVGASDGMGGQLNDFVTVIERYWVAIFPPQHQPRQREDAGEAASQLHSAIGDPNRNGRTIMVGDRFIDEKNNETYIVEGPIRPRRSSPLNALHRYELRLIKDGEPVRS